jgi:hypothetical protein
MIAADPRNNGKHKKNSATCHIDAWDGEFCININNIIVVDTRIIKNFDHNTLKTYCRLDPALW